MNKSLLLIAIIFLLNLYNNRASNNFNMQKNYCDKNYFYFSNLLVYPLAVDREINIKNYGDLYFKISIYDEQMVKILSCNSSPNCSTVIDMKYFDPGKYFICIFSKNMEQKFTFQKRK